MPLFENLRQLAESEYVFRIQDNGGDSADRYTVAFSDGDYLALSASPSHPQGVSQWGEEMDPMTMDTWLEEGKVVDLAIGDLPPVVAAHVLSRVNEAWEDFLERARADCLAMPGGTGEPNPAVAPSRDEAEENEGISSSGGKGLYWSPEGVRVRLDGAETDDPGPYAEVEEALRASLPQHCSLSGPECFSTVETARLEPSAEVAEAIAAQEAKADEAWKAANPTSSFR